ncbi:MAG: iron ABC transporter permease [Planctomycetes bacterium]|nr:iron ABC transporter permease [Planctomycetota bacterium]
MQRDHAARWPARLPMLLIAALVVTFLVAPLLATLVQAAYGDPRSGLGAHRAPPGYSVTMAVGGAVLVLFVAFWRGALARVPLAFAVVFCVAMVGLPIAMMLHETVATEHGLSLAAWSQILATDVDRLQLRYSLQLGLCATMIAGVFGFGHAWLTTRTDLPFASVLAPLGVLPLVVPPILVAMGFADLIDASGFWVCAALLGTSYAPFVAVLTGRGLASIDGRIYEAAWIARGRGAADRMLLRSIRPEIAAGLLFAFVFVISEHGVPEFLTVKGKTWHTYAEGVFARWTRRATGTGHSALVSPIVAAVPLVVVIAIALALALRFRADTALRADPQPLPERTLGRWRWPALLLPVVYLSAGVGVPVLVMTRWAMGSTQLNEPMSADVLRRSFQSAIEQGGGDLANTVLLAVLATVLLIAVSVPLARAAARRARWIDHLSILPLAVPAVLLTIGFVKVYNTAPLGRVYDRIGFDFYDSLGIVGCAYAARFLPFGVLTLSHAMRRIPRSVDEAARISGRGPVARGLRIHLPLAFPAIWSAICLAFVLGLRELDTAVVLPGGNDTVVRRLSNIVHFGGEDTGGALALMLLAAACFLPLLTLLVTGRKLRPLS